MNPEDIDHLPSRPFKGFDWSKHAHAFQLVDALFDEYTAWYKGAGAGKRIRDKDKIKQHLTHFVLEAYRTHMAQPELCMGVHLGNAYYNPHGDRYHPNHLSYRIARNVTDFLVAAGYLERPAGMGQWHPDTKQRRTTRFRATPGLISLCDQYGINRYMIMPYEDPEFIILRAKKKRGQLSGAMIDYKDTPFTRRARKNLRKINKFISQQNINLDITDEQEQALLQRLRKRDDTAKDRFLDFTKKRLTRIFNNASFEEGGRFYGAWWQQIPGDYRPFITINGKRTVQLDYSGMHFAIMYAAMGMDIPMDDPYVLKDYGPHLRSHIKKAFNIIVNCASRAQAIGTIDGRIKDGKLPTEMGSGEKLIQAFIDTHPQIESRIASGEGIKGQFVDSQVAECVLLKGIDIGLCVLPIHDGFITTAGDEFVLERLMNEAFSEITGHNANIKPETFDLSVLPDTGNNTPYWVTRPNGTVEREGTLEGKATSFSQVIARDALWEGLDKHTEIRKNKTKRDEEWNAAIMLLD